jgi:hypothetical protein
MNLLDNSLFTVVLTLTATFLGLSIVVQVVQELYKYLRSSKGVAYQKALQDFLGPLAFELMRPGVIPDVRVRGPIQLKRVRPKGKILPLKQDELADALERTAPPWIQRTLKQLKTEIEFQDNGPNVLSNTWDEFLDELAKTEQGAPGFWNAYEIAEFLSKEWKFNWQPVWNVSKTVIDQIGPLTSPSGKLDAKKLLLSFRKRFLPHVENAVNKFPQLEKNFEYTYGRSNKRLTFVIALLIAFFFNFPINVLYENAKKVDPSTAANLAEKMIDVYNQQIVLPDSLLGENLKLANQIITQTLKDQSNKDVVEYYSDWSSIPDMFSGNFRFLLNLFYCGITAIFLTFGAPFWNDIASSLLRLQKGPAQKNNTSPEGKNG